MKDLIYSFSRAVDDVNETSEQLRVYNSVLSERRAALKEALNSYRRQNPDFVFSEGVNYLKCSYHTLVLSVCDGEIDEIDVLDFKEIE